MDPTPEVGKTKKILGYRIVNKTSKDEGGKIVYHTFDTISEEFVGGEETSFAHKMYAHKVLNIEDLPKNLEEGDEDTRNGDSLLRKRYGIHPPL